MKSKNPDQGTVDLGLRIIAQVAGACPEDWEAKTPLFLHHVARLVEEARFGFFGSEEEFHRRLGDFAGFKKKRAKPSRKGKSR